MCAPKHGLTVTFTYPALWRISEDGPCPLGACLKCIFYNLQVQGFINQGKRAPSFYLGKSLCVILGFWGNWITKISLWGEQHRTDPDDSEVCTCRESDLARLSIGSGRLTSWLISWHGHILYTPSELQVFTNLEYQILPSEISFHDYGIYIPVTAILKWRALCLCYMGRWTQQKNRLVTGNLDRQFVGWPNALIFHICACCPHTNSSYSLSLPRVPWFVWHVVFLFNS